jgi:hypothetical protein
MGVFPNFRKPTAKPAMTDLEALSAKVQKQEALYCEDQIR